MESIMPWHPEGHLPHLFREASVCNELTKSSTEADRQNAAAEREKKMMEAKLEGKNVLMKRLTEAWGQMLIHEESSTHFINLNTCRCCSCGD